MEAETGRQTRKATRPASAVSFSQTLSSLQYANFRRLWLGQFGTSGSQWMEIVARGWLVYNMTGSAMMLGLISAVRAAPLVLFGMFGGVLADRLDRRKLLLAAQLSNMVLNLILALLIVTHSLEVWHVFATGLLAGVVMSFQQPARQAMISSLVDERDLMNAIALNAAAANISRSVGPALAGFAVGSIGMEGAYFAQAALLLWASCLTYSIKAQPSTAPLHKSSMLRDMKEGLGYVRSNETILLLLVLALVPLVLASPYQMMMPVFAKDELAIGPEGLGILLSAPGIGALAGATAIASLNSFRRRGLLLLACAGLFGLTLTVFSLSHWAVLLVLARIAPGAMETNFLAVNQTFWMVFSVVVLVAVGIAQSGFFAVDQTLLQTHTPDELRGRVMAFFYLDTGLGPLGTTLAGALTGFMGAPATIGLMGSVCSLLALGLAIAKPTLRRLS